MNTLFNYLSCQDPAHVALIIQNDKKYTVADLLNSANVIRTSGLLNAMDNVIISDDIAKFIISLIACDGVVNTIYLQIRQFLSNQSKSSETTFESFQLLKPEQKTRWVLTTSGTTGVPKFISHTFSSLTLTTKKNIQVGVDYRWGLLYDPARFAGLQVLLQSLLGGSTLVVPQTKNLDDAVNFMIEHRVNAISATPSFWRKMLMTNSVSLLPLKQITLGGEIADETILCALRKIFQNCRIVHLYASTEVGVGFAVNDCKPGFPITYLVKGTLNMIHPKIKEDGHLWIRRTNSENNPIFDSAVNVDDEGYLDTGDLVQICGDRVFFQGRESGVINVGGLKIIPEAVEKVLYSHPSVISVRVYGKRNSFLGHLVAADVQVTEYVSQEVLKKELYDHCKKRLESFQCPAIINIVHSIPLSESGKIHRKGGALENG